MPKVDVQLVGAEGKRCPGSNGQVGLIMVRLSSLLRTILI